MTEVSITGPKERLQEVIETLYDLELLHIEDYEGEMETGDPFGEAEELSEMLVDVRSILSKLPDAEGREDFELEGLEEKIETVRTEVNELEDRRDERERKLDSVADRLEFLQKLEGSGLKLEDLEGSESLELLAGKFDTESFREAVETDRYEIREGEEAAVILYYTGVSDAVEEALSGIDFSEISIPEFEVSGDVDEAIEKLEERRSRLDKDSGNLDRDLQNLADEWRPRLEAAEKFLSEKVEKAEAPLRFATTDRTFTATGYVPDEQLEQLERELLDATDGSIHVERKEPEKPPVKHDNSRLVQPFESLTDLVAVPRYTELDPSFMILLTFPLMFGFMIGDAGYGLTTLLVFYAGYRMFPEATDIFKSLMYGSVALIAFGLAFGDAFGYVLFGQHSELAKITGIHGFKKVPILFDRAHHLGKVFEIAAVFGVFHVNAGYLLGMYNEYVQHDLKEAFLAKGSWILLEVGALLWYLYGLTAGAPVVAVSIIALYLGEGIEGVVEIPSLLSNILSYLRIFGVSVAAVALAAVVNSMAEPLFAMKTATGTVAGVLVLMVGHTFNTFIKIMEGFLQGIRLHYVELFTKFFEGGGRKYSPFGT